MENFVKSSASAIIIVLLNALFLLFDYWPKNWFGIPIILFGAFCYFYNKHIMGKYWSIKVKKQNKIVKSGFFKYVRHPLYLGALITCLGLIISTFNIYLLITFLLIDLPYTYYRARLEEKLLIKSLKGYKNYMKTTWMFIPRLF
jgi:protein-S-isoprenylcysteine O-methyltransferase Ste14